MNLFYIAIIFFGCFFQNAFSQTLTDRPIASYKKEWKDTVRYKVSIDSSKNINRPQMSIYKNVVVQKDTVKSINDKRKSKNSVENILKSEGKKDENN